MPFQKGQIANPQGLAKGKRMSTWMIQLSELDELPRPETLTVMGRIALKCLEKALEGGSREAEFIAELTELKTPATIVNVMPLEARQAMDLKLASREHPIAPDARA